ITRHHTTKVNRLLEYPIIIVLAYFDVLPLILPIKWRLISHTLSVVKAGINVIIPITKSRYSLTAVLCQSMVLNRLTVQVISTN
ncbi:hypothetical protein, partial [Streptococcus suis]|uniref:hypothetical protein n=1 Tax=Streptococcus suis TaxID=1307 RepID=UPI003703ED20